MSAGWFSDLEASSAAGVATAGDDLDAAAVALRDVAAGVADGFGRVSSGGVWLGPASHSAVGSGTLQQSRLGEAAAVLSAAASAVGSLAEAVTSAQAVARDARTDAAAHHLDIAGDGRVVRLTIPGPGEVPMPLPGRTPTPGLPIGPDPAVLRAHERAVREHRDALAGQEAAAERITRSLHRVRTALEDADTTGTAALQRAGAAADRLASTRGSRAWTGDLGGGDLVGALGRAGVFDVRVPTGPVDDGELRRLLAAADPAGVRAWAARLSDAQRDRLLAEHPELVGAGDGLPPEWRYAANRILLERALADARARGDARSVAAYADLLFAAPRAAGAASSGGHRQILLFEPSGDGRVAEVFGDLSAARRVGVVVPGITNDQWNFGRTAGSAAALQEAARAYGDNVATVAWLGYDTPGLGDAAFDDKAQAGAPLLASFVRGLPPGATPTIVAHSYGTLVTGTALRSGLHAGDVVFLGSPGVGSSDVGRLDVPAGQHVYAAKAPWDPVGYSENFGQDPSDPRFGATRLTTGSSPAGVITGHSGYFTPGSDSVTNLAKVVAGRPDLVSTVDQHVGVTEVVSDVHNLAFDAQRWAVRTGANGLADGHQWVADHAPLGPTRPLVDGAIAAERAVGEGADRGLHLVERLTDPDVVGDLWHDIRGDG